VWFAGELLECACGKLAWRTRKKYRATISEATSNDTGGFIVTVSDKAFALLLRMPTLTSGSKAITKTEWGAKVERCCGKIHTD
jgi:hypothetical protein